MSDNLPISRNNRKHTDNVFAWIFAGFVCSLCILTIYCGYYSDVRRIIYGYDSCGNICGKINQGDNSCQSKDLTNLPYLLMRYEEVNSSVSYLKKDCVQQCPNGYEKFRNRCVNKSEEISAESIAEDIIASWPEIMTMLLIALLSSIFMLVIFRIAIGFFVWIFFATIGTILISLSTTLWIIWSRSPISDKPVLLPAAIILTILTIIFLLVILILKKRIQLTILLYKEAGKVIIGMPKLLLQPVLTFMALAVIGLISTFNELRIESAGILTKNGDQFEYRKNFAMHFTRWYNLFGFIWFSQYAIDCQYMVVAGAVSKWFFTRDKTNLESPIWSSVKILMKFHSGTVSCGSLILTLFSFIRYIIQTLSRATHDSQTCIFGICFFCARCCENIIKYITRNAYILTAIYGYPFCHAGKAAFELIVSHISHITAINCIGSFILNMSKATIIFTTAFCGYLMIQHNQSIHHIWVPLTFGTIWAFLIAQIFISVYEMTIDTLFICFCVDCQLNDGSSSKPFYMSPSFMKYPYSKLNGKNGYFESIRVNNRSRHT